MNRYSFLALAAMAACVSAGCNKDDDGNTTDPKPDLLEAVFVDSNYQFTGVAKDPTGDAMFINYPRWSGPYKYGVVKVTGLPLPPLSRMNPPTCGLADSPEKTSGYVRKACTSTRPATCGCLTPPRPT